VRTLRTNPTPRVLRPGVFLLRTDLIFRLIKAIFSMS
jgi:hypothetical protein